MIQWFKDNPSGSLVAFGAFFVAPLSFLFWGLRRYQTAQKEGRTADAKKISETLMLVTLLSLPVLLLCFLFYSGCDMTRLSSNAPPNYPHLLTAAGSELRTGAAAAERRR